MVTKKIKFGEIWIADLSPRIGTELGKKRPVLVVQDQTLLDVEHPSTLVIPLTTNLIDDAYPLRVRIKAQDNLEKNSDILVDQLRAIDNKRLIHQSVTTCNSETMKRVIQAVFEIVRLPHHYSS